MDSKVYDSVRPYLRIVLDGYNCAMFSDENEFLEKANYYLENEDKRMEIVNIAYRHFITTHTWKMSAKRIKSIIEEYIK